MPSSVGVENLEYGTKKQKKIIMSVPGGGCASRSRSTFHVATNFPQKEVLDGRRMELKKRDADAAVAVPMD